MTGRLKDQRDVAMVTVLFVGAVLTAVTSAAAFLSVRELRSGLGERRGAQALSIAETGINRFLIDVRGGSLDWGQLKLAGCPNPITLAGNLGGGSFTAKLTIYDPTQPPANRLGGNAATAPCTTRITARPPRGAAQTCPLYTSSCFAITSTGTITSGGTTVATRVVQELVTIGDSGLPIGLSSDFVSAGGTPNANNISVLSRNDVQGREKLSFTGNDAYYLQSDFYAGSPATPIPGAAHAVGSVYVKNAPVHPPNANCTASGEYAWDGSGLGGTNTAVCVGGNAPTSKFTLQDFNNLAPEPVISEQDYAALRATAQRTGLYCGPNLSTCTKGGAPHTLTGNIKASDIAGLPTDFVAFFDFPAPYSSGNSPNWDAVVNAAPTTCSDGTPYPQVTLVVRNGDLALTSGSSVTGIILVPDGTVKLGGNYTVHGTILSRESSLQGTGTVALSDCWVAHLPGPALEATRLRYGELDR